MAPDGTELGEEEHGAGTPVTAHRSAPDRTVFVEDGNCDGWIATDLTVPLDP